MRVLITRPEREAAVLASALAERGYTPVVAPLFQLHILQPPEDFAAALAACQAILVTSANGVRALAEATDQRSKPILAVGDTTAATAEGLGFSSVASAAGDAAALTALVRERLDPARGPLLHVSGVDVAGELAPDGFETRHFALYEAREAEILPESARAALEARAVEAVTFFSRRASAAFARLVDSAGLTEACRATTAVAISQAAAEPLRTLPFRATVVADRPTRQAVLDEIDRLATAVVQGPDTMSDPAFPPSSPPPMPPVQARRGLGWLGAFLAGGVAAVVVLAGALVSLPYWPEEARILWRGATVAPAPPTPVPDATGAIDAARRELGQRLDDLDRRVRAVAAVAAQADRPIASDPSIADLRARVDALEKRPAPEAVPVPTAPAGGETDKDVAALKAEFDRLSAALATLDRVVAEQKGAIGKAQAAAGATDAEIQNAVAAARASALIGVAARLNAALEAGLPFASGLALLEPLVKGDAKLTEAVAALQPLATTGVASRAVLAADFPAVAKAVLAEDVADDSLGERVLSKIRGIVSLRRVGADVEGDTAEAKLARAEAALDAGDVAKAVGLVKTLPPQPGRAAASWLSRAEAHLAARGAVDQIAAAAVAQLAAAR